MRMEFYITFEILSLCIPQRFLLGLNVSGDKKKVCSSQRKEIPPPPPLQRPSMVTLCASVYEGELNIRFVIT